MAYTPFTNIPEPSMVGTHFGMKGTKKYFNPRNVNGQQFNRPAVKAAAQTGVESYSRAQYFRRAGFEAALRYTLGMQQVPSHVSDYLNARTHGQRQTGRREPAASPQQEADVASGRAREAGAENRAYYKRTMRDPEEQRQSYRRAMGFPEAPFTDIRKGTP